MRDPKKLQKLARENVQAYTPGRDLERKSMLAIRRVEQIARTSTTTHGIWPEELARARETAGRGKRFRRTRDL